MKSIRKLVMFLALVAPARAAEAQVKPDTCTPIQSSPGRSVINNGAGSAGDPFLICTAAQLAEIWKSPGSAFALGRDIDLSGLGAFVPIQSGAEGFSGSFDGRGKSIIGMTINDLTPPYDPSGRYRFFNTGLFRVLNRAAIIRNVNFLRASVRANEQIGVYDYTSIGVLAGRNRGATIENVSVFSSSVSSIKQSQFAELDQVSVGGVIGLNDDGSIFSTTAVDVQVVSGSGHAGGIAGTMQPVTMVPSQKMTLSHSFSSGRIVARCDAGGLVGQGQQVAVSDTHSNATVQSVGPAVNIMFEDFPLCGVAGGLIGDAFDLNIEKSYYSGSVSAPSRTGGLVGQISYYGPPTPIKNSLMGGTITSTQGFTGAVAGISYLPITAENVSWIGRGTPSAYWKVTFGGVGIQIAPDLSGTTKVNSLIDLANYSTAPLSNFLYLSQWYPRQQMLPLLQGVSYHAVPKPSPVPSPLPTVN